MDNLESFINEQFEKREKIDAKQDNNELKNTNIEEKIINAQTNIKLYVLGPDLKARGLDKNSLITNIEIIDYKGFVKLVAENEKIQNWL